MINRTKQAFWGVTSDVFWQFVLTIVGFAATPIILQFISKPLYGFWIVTISILGYMGLLDLSIGASLTHLVARLSKTDTKALDQIASTAFFSFLGIGLLVLVLGFGISSYVPLWFDIPPNDWTVVILMFRISVVGLALSLPLSIFSGIITAGQRMAVATTIGRSTALVGIGLSLILLYQGVGLIALALSQLFTLLTGGLVSYLFCKFRYYSGLKISTRYIKKAIVRRLWTFGGYFQLGRIANTVALSTDAILIAAILGAAIVPVYTFTSKLAVLVSITLASKLPGALFPALSQMYAREEMGKVRSIFIMLAGYSTRMAAVFGVFILIGNKNFVTLWVGSDFFGGNILNIMFVSWVFLDSIYRGTGVVIQASGDLRKWSIISIVEALLNLCISIVLVRSLGLIGVALGTTISRAVSGTYIIMLACDKSQLLLWTFIRRGVLFPMLRSIPSCCMIIIAAFLVPQSLGWVWLCLIALAGMMTNILSFEGLELIKPSNIPLKARFRNIFVLR
jgi:O-antigen/teichoic acid export membrane protein